MKQVLTITGFFLLAFTASAQTGHEGHNHAAPATTTVAPSTVKPEALKLKEEAHDFGKIAQGKPVYYEFEIVNNSNEPLKLDNVSATCGCTTPEWSRDAIPAGATSKIKVGYNAAAEGPFTKYITITYGGTNVKQLKIDGHVWKAPEGSAPVNASIQFLKKQNL
jgi:hypothetical protein